ncbi:hypothetical protein L209DRAFT_15403 [Thermothelomyces heterothallicus CBS 203.75]
MWACWRVPSLYVQYCLWIPRSEQRSGGAEERRSGGTKNSPSSESEMQDIERSLKGAEAGRGQWAGTCSIGRGSFPACHFRWARARPMEGLGACGDLSAVRQSGCPQRRIVLPEWLRASGLLGAFMDVRTLSLIENIALFPGVRHQCNPRTSAPLIICPFATTHLKRPPRMHHVSRSCCLEVAITRLMKLSARGR